MKSLDQVQVVLDRMGCPCLNQNAAKKLAPARNASTNTTMTIIVGITHVGTRFFWGTGLFG
ncbi:MAG: hypothetical protein ABJA02_00605 [Acidobacteriota bacterium]